MSHDSGVCTIVPRNQSGFRPQVFGMGILVDVREIVTCAHVINVALGDAWQSSSRPAIENVCFPFTEQFICIEGTVDKKRWFAAGGVEGGELSDVAVIQLEKDAPASVERAVLQDHVVGALAKAYGFRGKRGLALTESLPETVA
jgi:hypothetical protein